MLYHLKYNQLKRKIPINIPHFFRNYTNLNKNQSKIISHSKGPLIVIGGPGTGKSYIISRKIVELINTNSVSPSEILTLTFTDKAACSIQERVDLSLPYELNHSLIKTFHSLAYHIIKELSIFLEMDKINLLTNVSKTLFLQENISKFPQKINHSENLTQKLLVYFGKLQDACITPKLFLESIDKEEFKNSNDKKFMNYLGKFYLEWTKLKKNYCKIEFSDQILYATDLLKNHPDKVMSLFSSIKLLLIDEFQDLNPLIFSFINNLITALKHRNIIIFGDNDQSIFGFRVAVKGNFQLFKKKYKESKIILLEENYRCHQEITKASKNLILNNGKKENRKNANILKIDNKVVRLITYDTMLNECYGIAKIIKDEIKSRSIMYKDIAILTRSNYDSKLVTSILLNQNIPVNKLFGQNIYNTNIIKLLMTFLQAITYPSDSKHLYSLMASKIYNFKSRDIMLLMSIANLNKVDLRKAIKLSIDKNEFKHIKIKLLRLLGNLDKFEKIALNSGIRYLLCVIIRYFKISLNLTEEEQIYINKFFSQLEDIEMVLKIDKSQFIIGYLEKLKKLSEEGIYDGFEDFMSLPNSVNVMTIHKAKGLEFYTVIIMNCADDVFPGRYRKYNLPIPQDLKRKFLDEEGDGHVEEERRLMYVGMTRAMKKLYFTFSKYKRIGYTRRRVSRFVNEALDR